jgi:hypothetical protein
MLDFRYQTYLFWEGFRSDWLVWKSNIFFRIWVESANFGGYLVLSHQEALWWILHRKSSCRHATHFYIINLKLSILSVLSLFNDNSGFDWLIKGYMRILGFWSICWEAPWSTSFSFFYYFSVLIILTICTDLSDFVPKTDHLR